MWIGGGAQPRGALELLGLFQHSDGAFFVAPRLVEKFDLDLSLVARLGGHSVPEPGVLMGVPPKDPPNDQIDSSSSPGNGLCLKGNWG